jgi:hypothetical protein
MQAGELIAQVANPEGRTVHLDAAAWNHVLEEHAEMEPFLEDAMAAIARPDHREPDPRPGRERYYRLGGPLGWIRVVTELAGDADRIVTIFPQSNDPRVGGWQR